MFRTMFTATLALLITSSAFAHPFAKDEYSLNTAVQVSERGLAAVVILEVPAPVVLAEVKAAIMAGTPKRKALKDHDNRRYAELGAALELLVDGQVQHVTWRPVNNPANGKLAEGFFLYWIGADVDVPQKKGSTLHVALKNTAYADVDKMVYTGSAVPGAPWQLTECSAEAVLGKSPAELDAGDPKDRWTKDAKLRSLTATFQR